MNFRNYSTEAVTEGPAGQQNPISGPRGSYYFGLLIAPPGTTAVNQFNFTGVYATNLAVPGYLFGGTVISVPGWYQGAVMSYLIAGWSASLGHDWNPQWQSGSFSNAGYFGFSTVATQTAGWSGGTPFTLELFEYPGGPATGYGISTGWNLDPVTPTVVAPQLSLTYLAGKVVLNWPTNYDYLGYRLQLTTNLSSSVWIANSAAPVVIDGLNTLTNDVQGNQMFFRISK